MNILSVDTSTAILSLALKTDSLYEEKLIKGNFSPSEDLLGEIKKLLTWADLEIKDLDLLITTKGPGSFTGLRIALSLLKGLSLSSDIPLVSVPTLSAVERSIGKFYNGPVLSVIDAKKKRFYYRITKGGAVIKEDTDEKTELILDEVKKFEEPLLLTGPDAHAFYEKAKELDPDINLLIDEDSPRNLSHSLIELGCKILEEKGPDDIGEGPVYIRRSDAEEMLIAKTLGEKNEG